MNALLGDIRYTLRGLFARPLFALVAIGSLALGIGANVAIFSVLHGLLLAPLPYRDGERLVDVYNSYPNMDLAHAGSSIPDFLDRKQQATTLEDIALYTDAPMNLAADGEAPERLVGLRATPSLFSTLGATAALGRVFDDEHGVIGADRVVVISDSLWRNRFNADPQIVGTDIRMSGQHYRVLGVMPAGFSFPNRNTQIWLPFAFTDAQRSDTERGNEYSQTVGRMRPGATIAQLNAELDAIVARNAERIGAIGGERAAGFADFLRGGNFAGRARPLRDQLIGDVRPMVLILQAAVGLVLLIAAANVANLMLARISGRQKELSVRNALGASRWRIARQVLVEALCLAGFGGLLGVALAALLIDLLPAIGLGDGPLARAIGLDLPVLLFACGVALLAGLLAALVPVVNLLRMNVARMIHDAGRLSGSGRASNLSRATLAVAQVAMATSLLIGAGLLLRSYLELQEQHPGFNADGVMTAMLALPAGKYPQPADQARYVDEALRELRAMPGISGASFVSALPFSGNNSQGSYAIDGLGIGSREAAPHGNQRQVDEEYFRTLQIPLLKGRTFTAADHADSEPVVIIDALLAEKHFAGREALGQRINRGDGQPWATVIGVVGTIKHDNLRDGVGKETLYWPYRQQPSAFGALLLRGPATAQADFAESLKSTLQRIDPEQPVFNVRGMPERIALSLQGQRAPMQLLLVFAAVALALSALGIYGVLAFGVSQRTGELGVRMAIGAGRQQIVALVLRQGAWLAGIGLAVGLLVGAALGQLAKSQLFGVTPYDPLTFAGVPLFLAAIALFAAWLPASRAARIDPQIALRHE